jgi:hypothetical protein
MREVVRGRPGTGATSHLCEDAASASATSAPIANVFETPADGKGAADQRNRREFMYVNSDMEKSVSRKEVGYLSSEATTVATAAGATACGS